jgi:putative ABC transport system substrate-binding protein
MFRQMTKPGPRRRVLLVAGAVALAVPLAALAQRAQRMPRIGFVSSTAPGPRNEAFLRGLRELGYVEGRNLHVELRFAEGRPERFPELVEELIRSKVDVLVVGSTLGARAAKRATTTIPVVFAGASDPVAGGILTNLARPEGNLTGLSLGYGDGIAGKWLELLKEAAPAMSQCAALWSSSNPVHAKYMQELEAAARKLGVKLEAHHAASVPELDAALAAIGAGGARGVVVMPGPFAAANQRKVIDFAAGKRLPAISFSADFAEAGGLLSYGPSITHAYRRAAVYVDKILKGAKPGDLPVEQPMTFELVVNLKTARVLGLKVPQSVLLRADRAIE